MANSSERETSDRADAAAITLAGERIEILRTRYRAQTFPRHAHETYTIGVGLRGIGSIWCRGESHVRGPGAIVVIPPGEVHTGGVGPHSDVLSYVVAYVPASLVDACASAAGVRGSLEFPVPVLNDDTIGRALRALESVFAAPSGLSAAQDALAVAIARLVRFHGGRRANVAIPDEPRLVSTTREIIRSCYADTSRTSLDALAGETGVTPFHLTRAFTRVTGMYPHHYLLQVRVDHARALLAAGEVPSIVAAMTGFADQSHLTMQFKRYAGITPGHYRRCLRAC
jgi:AraC-like DNA-binding protein